MGDSQKNGTFLKPGDSHFLSEGCFLWWVNDAFQKRYGCVLIPEPRNVTLCGKRVCKRNAVKDLEMRLPEVMQLGAKSDDGVLIRERLREI